MNRAIKVTFIVAAVMGLVCGTVFGYKEANQSCGAMESAYRMSAESVVSDFATQQFKHANTDHARQAVILQINILEQLKRVADDPATDAQLGSYYTRLAIVEEAAGQAEAERRALDKARALFKRAHPQVELTDDQMKRAVKEMDEELERLSN